jgi:serine/threonine protein kinase
MSLEDTLPASALQQGGVNPTDTIRPSTEETLAALVGPLKILAARTSSDFEKLRTLGEGGMGRVELARQRSLPREVALKSVKAERRNEHTEGALLLEAFCTGSLEHPNIVPVHAIEHDENGSPIIVMKKVEGVSWRELLRAASHPLLGDGDRLARHLEILLQVCNAVHFAHSRGIVHRDIKPENVMVGAFGQVYLVDWGIAIKLSEKERAQGFAGTPAYMAPEMLAGGGRLSEQTDIFLLGASLYEVLAGRPPFQGESLKAVVLEVTKAAPIVPSGPDELVKICQKAMHKEPSERYVDVPQFYMALTAFLQHQGSRKLTQEARLLNEEAQKIQEPLKRRKLYTESHFGLQQALKEWPENHQAREALDLCLGSWIALEIQEKNRGTAELLLGDLHKHRPDLVSGLEALKIQLQEEEGAKEKLAAMERERDLSGSKKIIIAVSIVGLLVALWGMFYILFRADDALVPDDVSQLFAMSLVPFSIVVGIGFWKRSTLFQNEIGRQNARAFLAVMTCFLLHRFLNFFLVRPLEQALTEEMMMIASFCGVMGAYLFSWFFIVSALVMGAAFISALYPSTAPLLISICSALPFVPLLALWRRQPQKRLGSIDKGV